MGESELDPINNPAEFSEKLRSCSLNGAALVIQAVQKTKPGENLFQDLNAIVVKKFSDDSRIPTKFSLWNRSQHPGDSQIIIGSAFSQVTLVFPGKTQGEVVQALLEGDKELNFGISCYPKNISNPKIFFNKSAMLCGGILSGSAKVSITRNTPQNTTSVIS